MRNFIGNVEVFGQNSANAESFAFVIAFENTDNSFDNRWWIVCISLHKRGHQAWLIDDIHQTIKFFVGELGEKCSDSYDSYSWYWLKKAILPGSHI